MLTPVDPAAAGASSCGIACWLGADGAHSGSAAPPASAASVAACCAAAAVLWNAPCPAVVPYRAPS